jgi:hypothetical protein
LASTGWFSEPQRAVRTILPAPYRHRSSIAFSAALSWLGGPGPCGRGDGHEEFLLKKCIKIKIFGRHVTITVSPILNLCEGIATPCLAALGSALARFACRL